MTCTTCRVQRRQDRLIVPCDIGGLDACWAWEVYETSPGIPPNPENVFALQLYGEIQRFGFEGAVALRQLELTTYEAEVLLLRLTWLHDNYSELEASYRELNQG